MVALRRYAQCTFVENGTGQSAKKLTALPDLGQTRTPRLAGTQTRCNVDAYIFFCGKRNRHGAKKTRIGDLTRDRKKARQAKYAIRVK